MAMGCYRCTPTNLCEPCLARWVEIHRGNAVAIGREWAAYVIARAGDRAGAQHWPSGTAKVRAIATRRVLHLAAIAPRAVEQLADVCAAAAGEAYEAWRAQG